MHEWRTITGFFSTQKDEREFMLWAFGEVLHDTREAYRLWNERHAEIMHLKPEGNKKEDIKQMVYLYRNSKTKGPKFFFQGKTFYDEESFLKEASEWPQRELTKKSYDYMFGCVKEEIWVNLEALGKANMNQGLAGKLISEITFDFLGKIDKEEI